MYIKIGKNFSKNILINEKILRKYISFSGDTNPIHTNKLTAKNYARSLNLKSRVEWYKFYEENKFPNIPKNPQSLYKNKGWKGWKDFLGTKNK